MFVYTLYIIFPYTTILYILFFILTIHTPSTTTTRLWLRGLYREGRRHSAGRAEGALRHRQLQRAQQEGTYVNYSVRLYDSTLLLLYYCYCSYLCVFQILYSAK